MPRNFIQPYVPPPRTWSVDWSPRDYSVPEPKILPPAPTFQKWVPQGDTIAFGELPRESSALQDRPQGFYPQPPVIPAPPAAPQGPFVRPRFDPPWTHRDYAANQDRFSILATPRLPPPVQTWGPQWEPYYPWTLRDYAANQDRFSWISGTAAPTVIVPAPDMIVFGELPPDQTALQLSVAKPVRFDALVAPAQYVPAPRRFAFELRPADPTPYLVAQVSYTAFSGIPVVPSFTAFAGYEYEVEDLTAQMLAMNVRSVPPPVVPYVFPTPPPYVEPPGWTLAQYQAHQDRLSALLTPRRSAFPVGLKPIFTHEALIRDIPRPQNLPLTFFIPPPPPRVVPHVPEYMEWQQWSPRDYDSHQARIAAFIASLPVLPGFLVMAVVAGTYGGVYYQPGDVFMLAKASDYSAFNVNYGPNANTPQFGWMMAVAAGTALISQSSTAYQPTPLYPVLNPVPPNRTVY